MSHRRHGRYRIVPGELPGDLYTAPAPWPPGGRPTNDAMPIFALTAYAKNERANITHADRNEYRRLTGLLAEQYARRKS
jgi:hypothetical protein